MARKRSPAAPVATHPADRAVQLSDRVAVPDELRPGFDAVRAAFAAYEAGDDEAARAALQAIGLGSPYLEWKVFLRGLLAHAAGDDARAAENWSRLAADRLPAKLAATVRAGRLPASPLVERLRELRKDLGRDQPLTKAWKHVDALLPLIRAEQPGLEPKLAGVLYRAIVRQGEPGDVARYRRAFGAPADDPQFHRLEALACEDSGHRAEAAEHWLKYEQWLATHPPGWPAELVARARAVLLHRAGLSAQPADEPEPMAALRSLFDEPGRRRSGPKSEELFRRSAALAPDWSPPALALFDRYRDAGSPLKAEAVARDLLARRPYDLPTLRRLVGLYRDEKRPADALAAARRALAANPLDRKLRDDVGLAYLSAARAALIAGDPTAADALLTEATDTAADTYPAAYLSLRTVAARKAGRKAEAADLEARALAADRRYLAACLYLAADGLLAKLKPADRKPADARLAEAFATPVPHPFGVNMLFGAWNVYAHEGVAYRGHKAQGAKIVALAERSVGSPDGSELDYEVLLSQVQAGGFWKPLTAMAKALARRFPADPAFPLAEAEALGAKATSYATERRIVGLLEDAKRLAEASSEPRHQQYLERIAAVRRRYETADDLFRFLFDRRR